MEKINELCPDSYHMGNLLLDESFQVLKMSRYKRAKVYYGCEWFGSASDDKYMLENAVKYTRFEMVDIIHGKEI